MSAQYTRAEYIGIGQKIGMLFEKAEVDLAEIRKAVDHPAYMPQMIQLLLEINFTHSLPEGRLNLVAKECKQAVDPQGCGIYAPLVWNRISRYIVDGSAFGRLRKSELIYAILLYQDELQPSNIHLSEMLRRYSYPDVLAKERRQELYYEIVRQAKYLYEEAQYTLGVTMGDSRTCEQVHQAGEIDDRTSEILAHNYIRYFAEVSTWTERDLRKLPGLGIKRCKSIRSAALAAGYDLAD